MGAAAFVHNMPYGAEVAASGVVRFQLWAPAMHKPAVRLIESGDVLPMFKASDGFFALETDRARPGDHYLFCLDDGLEVPDPASRFQPQDVNGPSQIVDPRRYRWRTTAWPGRPFHETVLYELHLGTFSEQGDYTGLAAKLDHLAEIGVTAIELMPIADFAGQRNWGYDGVLPFAPDAAYGTPEQLKALIDACHVRGLMIFLDVVYNHFGPEGNYLGCYA